MARWSLKPVFRYCLNVCFGATYHEVLKERWVYISYLYCKWARRRWPSVLGDDSFSCLFLPSTLCRVIFSWRLFFVKGAALGDINPVVFVPRTSLHASHNSKYTVRRQTAEKLLKKLVRCLSSPCSQHPKWPNCKLPSLFPLPVILTVLHPAVDSANNCME